MPKAAAKNTAKPKAKPAAQKLSFAKKWQEKVASSEVKYPKKGRKLTKENMRKWVKGEVTLAKAMGFSAAKAYGLAKLGTKMMAIKRWDSAMKIFDGLIVLNPYDGYFHSAKGIICYQKGDLERALREFSLAINLGFINAQVLLLRGELFLRKGLLAEGLLDLKKVIELDKKGDNPLTKRAKLMMLSTQKIIQDTLKAKSKTAGKK